MARPKKNNADYFSHESEMRNDVKIKALRRKFSHTGYAVWNYLLEVLTDAEGFSIKWEELDIELYAADFDLDASELIEIVNYCIKLGLLQTNKNMLYCSNLTSSFESLMNKRGRATRIPDSSNTAVSDAETTENKSFCRRNPSNTAVSDAETHIVEKSIVEYSKEDYSSPRTRESASAPSEEEKNEFYKIFFWRNMKDPGIECDKFIRHNEKYGWTMNNTPAKRKAAAESWVPEGKGDRVSGRFLSAWHALYKRIETSHPYAAAQMLNEDSRIAANNGSLVIHADKLVQDYIRENKPPEIMSMANGNPIRYAWP